MSQSFGMFSVEGNNAVATIVAYHKAHKSPWTLVYQNLRDLADSNQEKFGEAMDTVVREMVYDAVGCTGDFYV
jgi:hypothetical protein